MPVEPSEVEVQVNELETRVERLRSLYDQYFMGIEKLEPLVPKKDVERRLALLRKEQIKNTGLRFKFQMIVQRYNTFITYWQRISRQMEEGRYKRDVMRAKRRFGIDPTLLGEGATKERDAEAARQEREKAEEKKKQGSVVELSDDAIAELEEYDIDTSFDLDVDDEVAAAPPPPTAALKPASAPHTKAFGRESQFDLGDLADPFEEVDPFPKPREPRSQGKIRVVARPTMQPADKRGDRPPQTEPGLGEVPGDTERRIPVATPAPETRAGVAPPPIARRPGTMPSAPSIQPAPMPRGVIAPPPTAGATMGPSPLAPDPQLPPMPRRAGTLPSAGIPAPTIMPKQTGGETIMPRVASPAGATIAPRIAAPTIAPMYQSGIGGASLPPQRMAPTVMPGARPTNVPAAVPKSTNLPPPGIGRSIAVSAKSPAASPPGATIAPKPAHRGPGDLSESRFGEIYSQYVETRRKQNEPTGAITKEALAKQLTDSTQRLKQKHAGKNVDFEVVVKDGKTILRPVVK